MNDPINVTFGFDKKIFKRAIMAFFFSAVPRPSTRFRLIFWLCVWLTVLAGVIVVGALKIPPVFAWGGAAAIIGLYILGLQRFRMARFYRALGAHWDRTGDMTAAFNRDGALFTQTGTRMEFAWNAVDDITRARGATVLRIGMSMFAIPDTVIPNGQSPTDFRKQLNEWRGA